MTNAGTGSPNRLLHVAPEPTSTLNASSPTRLLETRTGPGLGTIDGAFSGIGPVGPDSTLVLPIAGRGNVPTTGAASSSSTSPSPNPPPPRSSPPTPPAAPDPTPPTSPSPPARPSPPRHRPPGTNRTISLYNLTGTTHLIVDVLGWFPTGPSFNGTSPTRLLETRTGPGLGTIDGALRHRTRRTRQHPRAPHRRTRHVPTTGAASVVVNIFVTEPTAPSFLTAYPTGGTRPNAANLTFTTGQTISNLAIVPLGTNGTISLYNLTGTTHLIVDVLGWFPTGPSFNGTSPTELLETRTGPGLGTIDGAFSGIGPVGPDSTLVLPIAGRGNVPTTGTASVVVNISVTEPTAPSFLTAYPTGGTRPNAANLTFTTGQTISNLAIVPLGTNGTISLYNLTGTTHLIVDVLGWFPTS